MSARQRKRMQEQQLQRAGSESDSDEQAATASIAYPKKSTAASFALLGDSSDESADERSEDDASAAAAKPSAAASPPSTSKAPVQSPAAAANLSAVSSSAPHAASPATRPAPTASASAAPARAASASAAPAAAINHWPQFDLDAAIRATERLAAVLRPAEGKLCAEAEMRRAFGAAAAALDGAGEGGGAQGLRGFGGRFGHAGSGAAGRGRAVFILASTAADNHYFAAPSKLAGGISMNRLGGSAVSSSSSGSGAVMTFQLEESLEWRNMTSRYEMVSNLGDVHSLQYLLQEAPWHWELCLGLSDYCRTVRQHAAAAEYLRRAVYSVESAFHPHFKPWLHPCRMALLPLEATGAGSGGAGRTLKTSQGAAVPSTHAVFARVMLKYMQHAGRTSCPDTALEVGRFLLQLQPTGADADPLRLLLQLDAYAHRVTGSPPSDSSSSNTSGGDHWLLELTGANADGGAVYSLRCTRAPAAVLPNLCFARALALFKQALSSGASGGARTGAGARASPSSPVTLFDDTSYCTYGPARMLARALLLYPHVLLPLLQELGLSTTDVGVPASLRNVTTATAASATAATASSIHLPALGKCVWQHVFDHPLYALPFTAYKSGDDNISSGGSSAALSRRTLWQLWSPSSTEDTVDTEADEVAEGAVGGSPAAQQHPRRQYRQVHFVPVLRKLVELFVQRPGTASAWRSELCLRFLYAGAYAAAAAYDAAVAQHEVTVAAARDEAPPSHRPSKQAPPRHVSSLQSAAATVALAATWPSTDTAIAEVHTAAIVREELYGCNPTPPLCTSAVGSAEAEAARRAMTAAREALGFYASGSKADYDDALVTIDEEEIARAEGAAAEGPGQFGVRAVGPPPGTLDLAHSNPLMLLFKSLLPWNRLP